ncbi:hypothetical protein DN069_00695 [Streptacidiphilus pinicola]|uniref:GH18 domain-containing protein n=1 Tax=Streptacidiphilus pinicola TaxID=2219663 RepID=A0A2X0JB74_9ACTN|nr:hypothetical protein [Streptacidiphilus pinicola]RAG87546.1 hypothetical protein DN069_00695 [Streptacidiphilus pinicola]
MGEFRPRKAVLALVTGVLVALAGCAGVLGGGAAAASPGAAGTVTSSGPAWIISGAELGRLVAENGAGAQRAFDHPSTYVLTSKASWGIPSGWSSTPTASFSSYAALQAAFAGHTVDPRIRAVLYDNEHWKLTPTNEQQDPVRYDRLAATLVHSHHLLFLASPATDLVKVLQPGATDVYQAFLNLGLLRQIAPFTDVVDVQAQGSESDQAEFSRFVDAAAAQARQANAHLRVLAGISTNPNGRTVTAGQVENAARAVRPHVDGFWLNDPGPGPACGSCRGPFPAMALALAKDLAGAS